MPGLFTNHAKGRDVAPPTSAGTISLGDESNGWRIHSARRQLFPLPRGEGQGEGQTDFAFVSLVPPRGKPKMNKTSTKMNTCGGGGCSFFAKRSRTSLRRRPEVGRA